MDRVEPVAASFATPGSRRCSGRLVSVNQKYLMMTQNQDISINMDNRWCIASVNLSMNSTWKHILHSDLVQKITSIHCTCFLSSFHLINNQDLCSTHALTRSWFSTHIQVRQQRRHRRTVPHHQGFCHHTMLKSSFISLSLHLSISTSLCATELSPSWCMISTEPCSRLMTTRIKTIMSIPRWNTSCRKSKRTSAKFQTWTLSSIAFATRFVASWSTKIM